jgi:FtsP/CotA-like multicopper oxidase with cupredoxin domain
MDNKPMGFINHTTWRPQPQPLTSTPRSAWDKYQFVPYIPLSNTTSFSKPTWVDLVINNLDDGAHPFHLHGHSFYVLSRHGTPRRQGWGSFNPFSGEQPPSGWNLESPLLKDTVAVPRMGHVIIRFLADNPGIWMLHCHMLIHQGTGLGMSIQIGEAENNEMAANIASQNGQHAALCREMQEGE